MEMHIKKSIYFEEEGQEVDEEGKEWGKKKKKLENEGKSEELAQGASANMKRREEEEREKREEAREGSGGKDKDKERPGEKPLKDGLKEHVQAKGKGTQFTCFTGTLYTASCNKLQQAASRFTCLTGTTYKY